MELLQLKSKQIAINVMKQKEVTLILEFESINRSATSESNFSCETSGISGLKLKLFFKRRTLPTTQAIQIISAKLVINH